MVDNIRRAEAELGLPCKIEMDLAGPKIRVESTNFSGRRFFKGDRVFLARESREIIGVSAHRHSEEAFDHAKVGHHV
jgi:pyruvate kinase